VALREKSKHLKETLKLRKRSRLEIEGEKSELELMEVSRLWIKMS